jgi:hypothetical protein
MMPFAMHASMLAPAGVAAWRVMRVGSLTRERMHQAPRLGVEVHSVFERAINLVWPDGRLLTLQGPGRLGAPFAAALSALPERGALAERMRVEPAAFDWEVAENIDLHMPPGPLRFPVDALTCPPVGASISPAARALDLALASRNGGALVTAALALIGLGEGLTPAGDDCLVGALAVLHRLTPDWLSDDSRVTEALAAAARTRTTDIARDFLLESLAGRFAESVLAVVTAESLLSARLAAERLARVGATSGADTLHGIRLAGRALERGSVA